MVKLKLGNLAERQKQKVRRRGRGRGMPSFPFFGVPLFFFGFVGEISFSFPKHSLNTLLFPQRKIPSGTISFASFE
jgi:hypothetical protein